MIIGSTVSTDGAILQRLPVATKVAIGLAPSGSKKWPERLDHFLVMKRGTEKGAWVPDPDKMKVYAPQCQHDVAESCAHCCREIKILLLDDDLENVFPHQLAWWGRSGKKCWGDGEKAMRRRDEEGEAQPWTPCRNAGCPDFERGDCAASGDLRFCLADFPVLGSTARIHTSSLRSCENLYSALNLIQTFTGGRLAGVTVPLCVSMEQSSYMEEGKRKSTTVPILSIRTGVNDLVQNIKNTMQLWDSARSAFKGRKLLVEDDEEARSAEIPPEFPRKEQSQLAAAPFPSTAATQPLVVQAAELQAAHPAAAFPSTVVAEAKVEPVPVTRPAAPPAPVDKSKSANPRMVCDGLVKSIVQKQGQPKKKKSGGSVPGVTYWEVFMQPTGTTDPHDQVGVITFSSTVAKQLYESEAQSREVVLQCELRTGKTAQKLVADECGPKIPAEAPAEDTSWFEPDPEE